MERHGLQYIITYCCGTRGYQYEPPTMYSALSHAHVLWGGRMHNGADLKHAFKQLSLPALGVFRPF
jgi:hypothetical protein